MSATFYRYWAAGLCPCCGSTLDDWIDGTEPAAIGEGVMICGRCVAMEHMSRPGEESMRDAMLAAIALRDDAPFEDAMPAGLGALVTSSRSV